MPPFSFRNYVSAATSINIPLALSNYGFTQVRANSLAKPFSFNSQQPRYFDQYATFYSIYQVFYTIVDVNFWLKDDTNESIVVGIYGSQGAPAGFANTRELLEATEILRPKYATLTSSKRSARLRSGFHNADLAAVTKKQYSTQSLFEATTLNEPGFITGIYVLAYTMDGTLSSTGVDCTITVKQFTRHRDPLKVAAS